MRLGMGTGTLLGAVVATLLAGCTSGAPLGADDSGRPATAAVTRERAHPGASVRAGDAKDPTGKRAAVTAPTPLDPYSLDAAESIAVNRAVQLLAKRCMQKRGFTWRPTGPIEPSAYSDVPNLRTGYQTRDTDPAFLAWQVAMNRWQNDEGSQAPSAAYIEAYSGRPQEQTHGLGAHDGGCVGDAQQRIAGPMSQLVSRNPVVRQIYDESWARGQASPRVTAVAKQWSACMRAGGYDYAEPERALRDDRWGGFDATPAELAAARTDIACQTRYRYYPVLYAAINEAQRALIAKKSQQLAAVKKGMDDTLRNAAAVVRAG